MTVLVAHEDRTLAAEVLTHLEVQLVSARKLLGIVLEQGAAIRVRDVKEVVQCVGRLQAELSHRQLLEEERDRLLRRAGAQLGVSSNTVTLTQLSALMAPAQAIEAQRRSQELQGLLKELQHEHTVNRILMSQELQFLDYLLRLAGQGGTLGYTSKGHQTSTASVVASRQRVLDMEV